MCHGTRGWGPLRTRAGDRPTGDPGKVARGAPGKPASGATGEVGEANPFVAAPPYSRHACVEATAGMKQDARPPCHAHAHELFGGVAVRCVCDNPKACVAKHPREGEVVPNEAYEFLGRHHMCAAMPTGARRPRQKPSAEGSAGDIAAAIARPRDQAF